MGPEIHDHTSLRHVCNFLRNLFQRRRAIDTPVVFDPASCQKHGIRVFGYLLRSPGEARALIKSGLCRGGEYDGAAVLRTQQFNRAQRGVQQVRRQRLRLVKHDHTVRQLVQMAAVAGTVRKKRLQKSHIGGHNTRRIPPLTEFADIFIGVAVDLQQSGDNLLVIPDILLNNRQKRYHNDNSPLTVLLTMLQSEGKQAQCFAQARGRSQGKQSRLLLCSGKTIIEQLIAEAV